MESPFTTPDQRAAERTAKRQAVLLAAVRMFNERGYPATSLEDVAASLRHLQADHALRALIEEGMGDGSIAPADPKLLAFTLAGALNWPACWHVAGGELSAEAMAEQMVDILTAGLAPRRAD